MFSACFIEETHTCKISIPLLMNRTPCSTQGYKRRRWQIYIVQTQLSEITNVTIPLEEISSRQLNMKNKFNHNNINKTQTQKHEHHNRGTYPQSLSNSLNTSTVFKTSCGQMFIYW